ncbi:MAG: hypothetical protein KatS3mg050_2861 [Litorilinea sp.]|nr:MAG: hypothetical protein KatS3mg050_2861 [Litorilinea sp.]
MRRLPILLAVLGLMLAWVPTAAGQGDGIAGDAESPVAEYTVAECGRLDETAVRSELTGLARAALTETSGSLDIQGMVDRHWRALELDMALDQAVARAVGQVQAELPYWDRLLSGWSTQQAEALARQVAEQAFADPTFQARLDLLAGAVASEIAAEMEAASARSASAALLCLQAYVGEQYTGTLAQLFTDEIARDVAEIGPPVVEGSQLSPASVHIKALGGVGAIVAGQVVRSLARSLGQKLAGRIAGKAVARIVGRLGSTLVPVAGWIVGAGLIAWDLYEGSQGALPHIQEALQSQESKAHLRLEMATAIRAGLEEEVDAIAAQIAGTLVGEWEGFCQRHAALCALAASDPAYRELLSRTALAQVPRLDRLTALFLADLGPEALSQALADGSLEKLLTLPEAVETILRETRSPAVALAWARLAGSQLDRVVDLGLYKQWSPDALEPTLWQALLSMEDTAALMRLLALDAQELALFAGLPATHLVQLAQASTVEALKQAAAQVALLPPEERQRTLVRLAERMEEGADALAGLAPGVAPDAGEVKADQPQPETPATESQSSTRDGSAFYSDFFIDFYDNGVLVASVILLGILGALALVGWLRRLPNRP